MRFRHFFQERLLLEYAAVDFRPVLRKIQNLTRKVLEQEPLIGDPLQRLAMRVNGKTQVLMDFYDILASIDDFLRNNYRGGPGVVQPLEDVYDSYSRHVKEMSDESEDYAYFAERFRVASEIFLIYENVVDILAGREPDL